MYSVVVPTMWRYAPFVPFLSDLSKFHLIDEVIVVDNDPSRNPYSPSNSPPDKVRIVTKGTNISCNPAWNWGVELARHEKICLLNDDLVFDLRAFYHVDRVLSPPNSLIGMSASDPINGQAPITSGEIRVVPWTGQNTFGFGQLMFIHRDTWVPIPDGLNLYFGDNWIFDQHRKRKQPIHIITELLYKTPFAVTASEFGGDAVLRKEHALYYSLVGKI